MNSSKLEACRWLLALCNKAQQLAELLAPWHADQPALLRAPAADFRPSAEILELAVWLAALVDFPEGWLSQLRQAGASDLQLQDWQAQAQAAWSRETEEPLDWIWRALRHLKTWQQEGITPFAGYYSLRRLHFLSRGRSSRLIALIAQALRPAPNSPCPVPELSLKAENLLQTLNQDSFAVLPAYLSCESLEQIREFARTMPCYPSLAHTEHRDQVTGEYLLPRLRFDPQQPLAHRYDFHFADLWECQAIQKLAADPLWPWLAEQYLQTQVQLVMAYLWWSCPFDGPQSRYTGQVFHIDLDRFQFVNFFFYLCDVGSDNGCQVYVKGSHREMPLELALDQRWQDDDLLRVYGPDALTEVQAPAGSVIMANTLAYHKGKTLTSGTRLMFQLEFASCTLGENTPQIPKPQTVCQELKRALRQKPTTYPKLWQATNTC